MSVPTVTLANEIEIPAIGFGVYQINPGSETKQSVLAAIKAGYRSIDTAKIYGNEAGVGEAIAESGIRREELFITTKLWNSDQGYESALEAFDESLERLGLEYVDLYLIHWHKSDTSAESWRALEEIYESGRAKAIGVSNYQAKHLDDLMETAEITPMVNQVELHPYLQQDKLRAYHDQHDIITEAWSPLQQAGELLNDTVIVQLAESYGKTPAQIVLRWHYQLGNVAIPKTVSVERMTENISIFDFELTQEDMANISHLNRDMRIGPDPENVTF